MNVVEAALGHYQPAGDSRDADCIVGHSFGAPSEGAVNQELAQFIGDNAAGRPIIADRTLADALRI